MRKLKKWQSDSALCYRFPVLSESELFQIQVCGQGSIIPRFIVLCFCLPRQRDASNSDLHYGTYGDIVSRFYVSQIYLFGSYVFPKFAPVLCCGLGGLQLIAT